MRIQLAKVEKRFGKVHALREIDLELPAGAKVALIGPNGSGKTTLIRVLLGLVGYRGDVRIDGVAIDRRALAPRIAYVPQIAPQMAATCGDLVRAITDLRGLDAMRVRDVARRLELSVDDLAGLPFRSLSGGSKQKLLIALALAARPELLILDEPTASLDAEARGRFFELQRELAGDATLILCSHRLEEIRSLVDHVVALEEGRLIYDGDATRYLAQRVGSLLEVRVAGADPGARWLAEHGFSPGANGWWSRSVDRDAKLALVPEALGALGAALVDLVVRDVDLVELRGEVRHAGA
jgi:ABC-2 type transport system ATP-binding protein